MLSMVQPTQIIDQEIPEPNAYLTSMRTPNEILLIPILTFGHVHIHSIAGIVFR